MAHIIGIATAISWPIMAVLFSSVLKAPALASFFLSRLTGRAHYVLLPLSVRGSSTGNRRIKVDERYWSARSTLS